MTLCFENLFEYMPNKSVVQLAVYDTQAKKMPGLALTLLDRFPHLTPLFPRTDSLGAIRPMLAVQLGLGSGDSRRAMEYKP